ncbi:MAG: hypothetical protein R3C53_24700 [Pirellulaceae bacterium]
MNIAVSICTFVAVLFFAILGALAQQDETGGNERFLFKSIPGVERNFIEAIRPVSLGYREVARNLLTVDEKEIVGFRYIAFASFLRDSNLGRVVPEVGREVVVCVSTRASHVLLHCSLSPNGKFREYSPEFEIDGISTKATFKQFPSEEQIAAFLKSSEFGLYHLDNSVHTVVVFDYSGKKAVEAALKSVEHDVLVERQQRYNKKLLDSSQPFASP